MIFACPAHPAPPVRVPDVDLYPPPPPPPGPLTGADPLPCVTVFPSPPGPPPVTAAAPVPLVAVLPLAAVPPLPPPPPPEVTDVNPEPPENFVAPVEFDARPPADPVRVFSGVDFPPSATTVVDAKVELPPLTGDAPVVPAAPTTTV